MFNRRILILNFRPEQLPKFASNAEQTAFHAAVGRMALYGIYNERAVDSVDLVTGNIEKGEVCCAYHPALPEYPKTYQDGSTNYSDSTASEINDLIKSLDEKGQVLGRAFVMAAIDRGNGEWSFHS